MTDEHALREFKHLCQKNPYTGTAEEIVTLSLGIADASKQVDRSALALYREESGIGDKIFSKLKVIGETLRELTTPQRRDVVKVLPASYSAIHALCGLKAEELVTGAKSGSISSSLSVRSATAYVRQVRFPRLAAPDGEKGRWGTKQEHLFSVYRPEETPLAGDAVTALEEALRQVCTEHGVQLRQAGSDKTKALREQDRSERAAFWRRVLEGELTQKWFREMPDEVKKQFNLKTIDEVRDTPLRSFTGFLIRADGGREKFWEEHGNAYVAKVQFLMESTEDRAQRFNLKRRLEQVLGERPKLAIWNNVMLKQSGFM